MKRTRIKLCGMTTPEQVAVAVDLGVDAIGVIFYDKSPRCITIEQARLIRQAVPAFVSLVGVFVNEEIAAINTLAADVGLDLIQLHGNETPEQAQQLERPYIKAIQAKNAVFVQEQLIQHPHARGYLIDSYSETRYGGTGQRLNEQALPDQLPRHTIYAGGINCENIADVLQDQPYAVDVNSGVEVSPGNKDMQAVQRLISSVREYDLNMNNERLVK